MADALCSRSGKGDKLTMVYYSKWLLIGTYFAFVGFPDACLLNFLKIVLESVSPPHPYQDLNEA